jgi:hypothetical protein
MNPTSEAVKTEVKPGYKTTEFWLTMLVQVLSISIGVLGAMQPSPVVNILGIIVGAGLSLLSALGYNAKRTDLKKQELVSVATAVLQKVAPDLFKLGK